MSLSPAVKQILFQKKKTDVQDPFLNNVVLYLKGQGANGSTSIIDSSPNPKTITVFGNAQISTAQSKYGGSSIYLDGTGDYVSAPHSSDFVFGAGDFTIEVWVYAFTNDYWLGKGDASTAAGSTFVAASNFNIAVFYSGGTSYSLSTGTFLIGVWQHIALTRNGSILTCWKDGVSFSTTSIGSVSLNDTASSPIKIGSYGPGAINAYFDSFRITKTFRYTANFNPEIDTFMS